MLRSDSTHSAPAGRRESRKHRPGRLAGIAAAFVAALVPPFAEAQVPASALIRDAEIEQLLRDYADPVLAAAGAKRGAVQIILIGDRSFNAFVADGRRMFINVGAIMEAKTPNELIGVIAHESGHIAGGHLQRLREQVANAQILAVIGMLLGGAAAVGSARSGRDSKVGDGGTGAMGIMAGSYELARRSLLAYQRSEEQAADKMAVGYLTATRQSPRGLLETFKRFNQESMFKTASIDPYLVSHPLPMDRIANLEDQAKRSPYYDAKDPPALVARHELARAKLFGFIAKAEEVGRRYPASDTSVPARYARTIIAFRYKRLAEALAQVDGLIREYPSNPFFIELKGQILLEFGRPREAIPLLRKAVAMVPGAVPIRVMLGHALVASEDKANVDAALRELSNAVQREPENSEGWQHLSTAYGLKGNEGMASYAAAQASFTAGDYKQAANHAARAKEQLPANSPGWLKADDILNTRPPKQP